MPTHLPSPRIVLAVEALGKRSYSFFLASSGVHVVPAVRPHQVGELTTSDEVVDLEFEPSDDPLRIAYKTPAPRQHFRSSRLGIHLRQDSVTPPPVYGRTSRPRCRRQTASGGKHRVFSTAGRCEAREQAIPRAADRNAGRFRRTISRSVMDQAVRVDVRSSGHFAPCISIRLLDRTSERLGRARRPAGRTALQ